MKTPNFGNIISPYLYHTNIFHIIMPYEATIILFKIHSQILYIADYYVYLPATERIATL